MTTGTKLTVATVTAAAFSGVPHVDLTRLFHSIDITDASDVRYAELILPRVRVSKGVYELGHKPRTLARMTSPAPPSSHHSNNNGFPTMLSMLLRSAPGQPRAESGVGGVNVKLFQNGSMQMTGASSVECARQVAAAVARLAGGTMKDFRVCMINSIFRVDFAVDRAKLQRVLSEIGVASSYDPMTYHAVKIRDFSAAGPENRCVTVAVFQTGSVIVTGATSMRQATLAFKKYHRILVDYKRAIQRTQWHIIDGDGDDEESRVLDGLISGSPTQ